MTRKGDWIETYTGKKFYILDPKVEDVCIDDIAHSLSLISRYNGHCNRFYSVAEHCILMYDFAKNAGHKIPELLPILLHDAHEAYIGDITRPMKQCFNYLNSSFYDRFKCMVKNLDSVIYEALGVIDWAIDKEYIKFLDNAILGREKSELFPDSKNKWSGYEFELDVNIWGLSPAMAEMHFLKRFLGA